MGVIKYSPCNNLIFDASTPDSQNRDILGDADTWRALQSADPNDVTVVSDPNAISGSKYRVEINKGSPYTGGQTVSHRTEIFSFSHRKREGWVSMRYYFPSPYVDDPPREILWQLHAGSGSPFCSLQNRNGQFYIQQTNPSPPQNEYGLNGGTTKKDEWINIVIHYYIHPTAGRLETWCNGIKEVDYTGPFGLFDETEDVFYLKWGYYKWQWDPATLIEGPATQRVMYIDEISIGDEFSSFSEMDPMRNAEDPVAPPPIPPSTGQKYRMRFRVKEEM